MRLDRRGFLGKMAVGSAGIIVAGTSFAEKFVPVPYFINSTDKVIFPFFKYLKSYNFGDFNSKDQGGKFIQQQLINSEDDAVIVETVRNGILQKILGDPINWAKLETTELEKSVWLNRFYYLPPFARLYHLTKDKSYLEDMMNIVRLWINDNPRVTEHPTSKYNWYDMQVAWRSIHLSWCYYLGEEGLSSEDKTLIFNSLKEHADILAEGFGKQKLNEFNHQAHGGLAMLYLGILFPDLPQANELRDGAIRILNHHIEFAFYSDGGNVEQMFGYYPFETSIFRDAYLLCRMNGVNPPEDTISLLKKMANYISQIAQPDYTMPPVNDSFPMPVKPVLETVGELLKLDDLSYNEPGSKYLPETQIGVMRTGTSANDWYLLANPAKTIGSHAHAGRLGFVAWLGQQPLFIESGCNNYDDSLLVKWYRTSRAHNTVIIDGQEDEATSGDVQWTAKRQTENRITDWVEKENYRLVRMISPSTEKTNQSVNWIRNLALIRNDYLLIYDYFDANESHNYEILLHLPQVEVEIDEAEKTFLIKTESPVALIPANKETYKRLKPDQSYISVNAQDVMAPLVSYEMEGSQAHSVLVATPDTELNIKQEILDNGIVLTIEHTPGKKDIILFRKPGALSFQYKKYITEDWIAVF
ncbi:MAG: heparinase II/III family protein [Draconibacterium sp.]